MHFVLHVEMNEKKLVVEVEEAEEVENCQRIDQPRDDQSIDNASRWSGTFRRWTGH